MTIIKRYNKIKSAFTLIEMIIVMIIIGILLMATVYMSGDQIQKVKNKTVKEAILSEMQTRYSKNLGSSSFGGEIYDTMEVVFSGGDNEINFKYKIGDDVKKENILRDNFEIKRITTNFSGNNHSGSLDELILSYTPYNISCNIGNNESNFNAAFIIRINDKKNYCFEINQKNCRLIEMSESKCKHFGNIIGAPID